MWVMTKNACQSSVSVGTTSGVTVSHGYGPHGGMGANQSAIAGVGVAAQQNTWPSTWITPGTYVQIVPTTVPTTVIPTNAWYTNTPGSGWEQVYAQDPWYDGPTLEVGDLVRFTVEQSVSVSHLALVMPAVYGPHVLCPCRVHARAHYHVMLHGGASPGQLSVIEFGSAVHGSVERLSHAA